MAFIGLVNINRRENVKKVKKKVCSNEQCDFAGIKQSIKEFYRRTQNPDGHACQCRTCERKVQKEIIREKRRNANLYFPF